MTIRLKHTKFGADQDDATLVQNAIRQDSHVELVGTWDFQNQTVTIEGGTITGITERGAGRIRPTIVGGGPAFSVNAPDSAVVIENLDFSGQTFTAIQALAAGTLVIKGCTIGSLKPFDAGGFTTAIGILVGAKGVRSKIRAIMLSSNIIDVGLSRPHRTLGILINQAGVDAGAPVLAQVLLNQITHVTAFGVDLRSILGTAIIQSNTIEMRSGVGKDIPIAAISCRGSGEHLVRNNIITSINLQQCAGIRVTSDQSSGSTSIPIAGATVDENDITMLVPPMGSGSTIEPDAAIEIRGNATSNRARNNKIRGSAKAALSLVKDNFKGKELLPSTNGFEGNHHENSDFGSSVADIFVGIGASNTRIIAAPQSLVTGDIAGTIKKEDPKDTTTFIVGNYTIK